MPARSVAFAHSFPLSIQSHTKRYRDQQPPNTSTKFYRLFHMWRFTVSIAVYVNFLKETKKKHPTDRFHTHNLCSVRLVQIEEQNDTIAVTRFQATMAFSTWHFQNIPFSAAIHCSLIVYFLLFASQINDANGQIEKQPWYDALPAVAMDYKIHLPAGKEDCYYQYVQPGATLYVSFQVCKLTIARYDRDRAMNFLFHQRCVSISCVIHVG